MRKFSRSAEPEICTTHSAKWNDRWATLCRENSKAKFSWYVAEGKTAREHLLPPLRKQTQEHCSFCDAFPVEGISNETIEHFRPKSRFYDQAYTWSNLYYCCDACQNAKREQWDDQLLHADAAEYFFSKYFEYDFTTGEIRPNPLANPEDQQRAAVTVRLYGLDSAARRRNRLNELLQYTKCEPDAIANEKWAYRDFLGI